MFKCLVSSKSSLFYSYFSSKLKYKIMNACILRKGYNLNSNVSRNRSGRWNRSSSRSYSGRGSSSLCGSWGGSWCRSWSRH